MVFKTDELQIVTSIQEIYDLIEAYKLFFNLPRKRKEDREDIPCLDVFFRGQSDSEWDIIPSILRGSHIEEQNQIKMYAPNPALPLFEMIALIQHKYTGTRFIDFTTNPDVAIFFACNEHEDRDGAFFMYNYLPHKPEWYTTVVLSELIQIPSNDLISVNEFSAKILKHYPSIQNVFLTIKELNAAIVSFLDHGFMILPDEKTGSHNLRLNRQSGCFYGCGVQFENNIYSESWRRTATYAGQQRFYPHSVIVPSNLTKNLTNVLSNGHPLKKVIIPKEHKRAMMDELRIKGITQEYLLP